MWLNKSNISSTFKSAYTEEFLDTIFYRPIGYGIALVCRALGCTPNSVTLFSILVGMAAGHLFYYQSLWLNATGVLLLIFADALDSADGQLARMTGQKSRYGRILDGFSENLWFLSIYLHLYLRMVNTGVSSLLLVVIVISAISHSFQCAVADYYRNFFTYFIRGNVSSEIDNSQKLREDYTGLSWKQTFWKKLFMRLYLNYTIQQETISKGALRLYRYAEEKYSTGLPAFLTATVKNKMLPLIKYYNILTSNTRMLALFVAVLCNVIPLYFIFEIICLNLLLVYVVIRHEANCKTILKQLQKVGA
jgi:phosphatidylglycerophosphate synthase